MILKPFIRNKNVLVKSMGKIREQDMHQAQPGEELWAKIGEWKMEKFQLNIIYTSMNKSRFVINFQRYFNGQ